MPKRVDHEQRRREIADALVRCARRRGLHATGFREVAAEAGVSVNLVQHYFGTKENLLLGGLRRVAERAAERTYARLAELPADTTPRDRLEAGLRQLLPTDPIGRDLYVVHAAYGSLALTDPRLAAQPYLTDAGNLEDRVTELLDAAAPGRFVDVRRQAVELIALTTGLAGVVVTEQHSVETAEAILRARLDELLPG